MRQAITTRYSGPTNTRGARVLVRADAGRMFVPWDHAMNPADNYHAAAKAYALRKGWRGTWSGGVLPGAAGYAFVVDDGDGFTIGGT